MYYACRQAFRARVMRNCCTRCLSIFKRPWCIRASEPPGAEIFSQTLRRPCSEPKVRTIYPQGQTTSKMITCSSLKPQSPHYPGTGSLRVRYLGALGLQCVQSSGRVNLQASFLMPLRLARGVKAPVNYHNHLFV